ncbi:hypothetical protein [Marilutibacter alkalisoli]|uniref:Uncharacterized protein n=1 Tax=Marilutibacter alkalisoli TaxID=2591633 RepID=A0A514BU62_9GAMM|nr:hypothetical protein [Lysobacter alkalisoli]QDH70877.1 hypothetical protein FKV23_12870 [Lysobacter alkalisoli]
MSGPDQLDALADQTEGQGLQVTAEALRGMARQWRRDRHALENAEAELVTVNREATAFVRRGKELLAQITHSNS